MVGALHDCREGQKACESSCVSGSGGVGGEPQTCYAASQETPALPEFQFPRQYRKQHNVVKNGVMRPEF